MCYNNVINIRMLIDHVEVARSAAGSPASHNVLGERPPSVGQWQESTHGCDLAIRDHDRPITLSTNGNETGITCGFRQTLSAIDAKHAKFVNIPRVHDY
jgi:hypothetical protein